MKINKFDGQFAFLSNFFPCVIIGEDEIVYPSVEHYFQAQKTNDLIQRQKIAEAQTPGIAKRMGRKVVLRSDWEEVKDKVMLFAVRQKFKDPRFGSLLLATGDAELIEGNYWGDTYWGVDINKGGENHLGKILMQVRIELHPIS